MTYGDIEYRGRVTGVELRAAGGKPTRPIKVQLIAEMGKLPDIRSVEPEGDDGSSLGEKELSPGMYKASFIKDVRCKMHEAKAAARQQIRNQKQTPLKLTVQTTSSQGFHSPLEALAVENQQILR